MSIDSQATISPPKIIESGSSEDSPKANRNDKISSKTQDILSKKKKDFKEIEKRLAKNNELTIKENQILNREISEIILRQDGKHRCLFNPQDEIFNLENETELKPNDSTICNTCCNPVKKPKFCQFCAQANCSNCQIKTRPFPINNPEKLRRGNICVQCDKKFLYRDALNENQLKLELRDQKQESLHQSLKKNESTYILSVNDLSNISNQRQQQMVKYKKYIAEITHLMNVQQEELQKTREEKEYQISQLKKAKEEYQHSLAKKKQMLEEIENTNKSINNFYEKFENVQNEQLALQDQYEDLKSESNRGTTIQAETYKLKTIFQNQNIANPRLINSYLPNMLKNSFRKTDFENLNRTSGIQTEFNLDMVRQDRRDSLYESVLIERQEVPKPEKQKRARSRSPMRAEESLYQNQNTVNQYQHFENYSQNMINDTEKKLTIQQKMQLKRRQKNKNGTGGMTCSQNEECVIF